MEDNKIVMTEAEFNKFIEKTIIECFTEPTYSIIDLISMGLISKKSLTKLGIKI